MATNFQTPMGMQKPFRFKVDEDTENYYLHWVIPKSQVAGTPCNPANDDRENQRASLASPMQKSSTPIGGPQTRHIFHSENIQQIVILESDNDQISFSNDKTHYSHEKRSETDLYVPESDSESDEAVLENDFSSGSASPEDDLGAGMNSANTPDTYGFVSNDEVQEASYAQSLICSPTQHRSQDNLSRCTSSLMEVTETSQLLVKGSKEINSSTSPLKKRNLHYCPFGNYKSTSLRIVRKHYDTHTAVRWRCSRCKVHFGSKRPFWAHLEIDGTHARTLTCGQSTNTKSCYSRC